MKTENEHLKSLYANLDTDELLRIHNNGTLTEFAYAVLESALTLKGVAIPARPQEPVFIDTPTPTWVRVGIFMVVMFLLHFCWIAIAKPIVGGGFIPQAIFTLLPLIFLWKKLFSKIKKAE